MQSLKANGSIAHTVGNVTFLITEMIKGFFDQKFFRHVHVNTRMVYREQKREENNSGYEFIKKNRPILVVKPKVDLTNTDIFLTHSLFTTNTYNAAFTGDSSNFMPFFRDMKSNIGISYLVNRIRVSFDVTIMLNTEYEQINTYNYLLNMVCPERVNYLKTALENYIPSKLVEYVSMLSGVPIRNEKGTVKDFLDYMMMNSNKYITFKERTSNSLEEFFMYYPLNIEWVMNDISIDEPSKKGFVVQSCNINFSITAEFNTVGLYELFYSDSLKGKMANADFSMTSTDGINIIPYFTIGNLFDVTDVNGWKLFYSNMFICENEGEPDELDLNPILGDNKSMLPEVVEYHNKHGISNSVIFHIILMRNNTQLSDKLDPSTCKKDYEFDYNTLKLKIFEPDANATYRIVIYVNNLYINNLVNTVNDIDCCYEQPVGKDASGRSKDDEGIGRK